MSAAASIASASASGSLPGLSATRTTSNSAPIQTMNVAIFHRPTAPSLSIILWCSTALTAAASWIIYIREWVNELEYSFERRYPGVLAAQALQIALEHSTADNIEGDIEMPDIEDTIVVDDSEFRYRREAHEFLEDTGIDFEELGVSEEVHQFFEWAAQLWVRGAGGFN